MKMSLALDWLFLKREARQRDMEFQAALHGAKLKDPQQDMGLGGLAGMIGSKKVNVKRVLVTKEELEKRKQNARNKL